MYLCKDIEEEEYASPISFREPSVGARRQKRKAELALEFCTENVRHE